MAGRAAILHGRSLLLYSIVGALCVNGRVGREYDRAVPLASPLGVTVAVGTGLCAAVRAATDVEMPLAYISAEQACWRFSTGIPIYRVWLGLKDCGILI